MKKVLWEVLQIILCVFIAVSLCACNTETNGGVNKSEGNLLHQLYTLGDLSGITADRKTTVYLDRTKGKVYQIVNETWVLKNTSDTEKTFVVASPVVFDHYDDNTKTIMDTEDAEIFTLYGGIGKDWECGQLDGTFKEKLTSGEYLKELENMPDEDELNELVTVYEFDSPNLKRLGSLQLSISFTYDKAKTRPFLNMVNWQDWDVSINGPDDTTRFEVTGSIRASRFNASRYNYRGEYTMPLGDSIVIFGEDIGADAIRVTATGENGEADEDFEIIRSVMTVKEMLEMDIKRIAQHSDVYELDETSRRNLYDLLFRSFCSYKENGYPVAVLEENNRKYDFEIFTGCLEFPDIFAPRDKRPENGNYVIDEGYTVDDFDIEYREFRDIGMMMENVRHGVDFLATDISIPAGGEKTVSIESMRRLRYTEVGGTYRLIIMPAPTDGMEYNSFDIEIRNTSEKEFYHNNLDLEISGNVGTASLDPYRDDYTVVFRNKTPQDS